MLFTSNIRVRKYFLNQWARSLAVLSVLVLSGCNSVWFDPYIDLPDRDLASDYSSTNNFPQLLVAAAQTEDLRRAANSNREQLVVGRSMLGYLTFAGAGAGGIAALYGADRDYVLALGTGAVSTYTAGTLFASTDRVDIYSATNRALGCVVETADSAMAQAKSLDDLTRSNGQYATNKGNLDNRIRAPNITWPPNLYEAATQAAKKYEAALVNMGTFKAQDSNFAVTVRRTTDTIIFAMEEKIQQTRTGLQGILSAAQGIGVAGVAFTKQVTPTPPPAVTPASASPATPLEEAELALLTGLVDEAAEKINGALTGATNRMDQLGTVCVLNAPSISPLTITPTNVTLAKDQTITLTSKGGKPPLRPKWQGKTPNSSDQIEVIVTGGTEIVLVGKNALPANDEFKLIVMDSLASPSEVLLTIKTP